MFSELPEHIGQLRRVSCSVSPGSASGGDFGLFVKVVEEHLRLAGLRLQTSPRPSVPAERRVAHQIARCPLSGKSFASRIGGQDFVRKLLVTFADTLNVGFLGLGASERCTFVGVVADQNRYVVVLSCTRKVCIDLPR